MPPPPPGAVTVFGQALPAAVAYAELLAGAGVERGLIGPREVPRLWDRHLLNCAVMAPAVPDGTVVDLGAGAGLPGIPVALLRPDLRILLVDATRRRTEFLVEVVARLGLSNVSVRWARAEDLAGSSSADAVIARAVAPLDRLAGWALPLLRVGGELLALKGSGAADEVMRTTTALRSAGAGDIAIEHWGEGVVDPPTTLVRLRKVQDPTPRGQRRKRGR